MAEPIKPLTRAGHTRLNGRGSLARCRMWLKQLTMEFAWILVSRHAGRASYCPAYRSNLAVLLHGLARDVALSLLCKPVHCYAHATHATWETGAELKRSPLLKR